MTDPTEYDPNSKDLTDDPDFPEPKCGVCGIPWVSHMGIMGVCLCNKALKEDLKESQEENAQLRKERDAARREVKFFDTALRIAAGLISTMPQYESTHPEEVLEMLKKEETQ